MGLDDRCMYIEGDMFREIPSVDVFIMKMILHDWNDEECIEILNNINRSCSSLDGRVFIVEHLITQPEKPHFSKPLNVYRKYYYCCLLLAFVFVLIVDVKCLIRQNVGA
jgi:hypothetical protein